MSLRRTHCHSLPGSKTPEMLLAGSGEFNIDFGDLRCCAITAIFKRESHGFRRSVDLQSAVLEC